jgi:hypothetical protein
MKRRRYLFESMTYSRRGWTHGENDVQASFRRLWRRSRHDPSAHRHLVDHVWCIRARTAFRMWELEQGERAAGDAGIAAFGLCCPLSPKTALPADRWRLGPCHPRRLRLRAVHPVPLFGAYLVFLRRDVAGD